VTSGSQCESLKKTARSIRVDFEGVAAADAIFSLSTVVSVSGRQALASGENMSGRVLSSGSGSKIKVFHDFEDSLGCASVLSKSCIIPV